MLRPDACSRSLPRLPARRRHTHGLPGQREEIIEEGCDGGHAARAGPIETSILLHPGCRLDYCSNDMTIEDMLLVCFSMAVPACINIWFEVMFDDSVAKSTSMIRPAAAWVLLEIFARFV